MLNAKENQLSEDNVTRQRILKFAVVKNTSFLSCQMSQVEKGYSRYLYLFCFLLTIY